MGPRVACRSRLGSDCRQQHDSSLAPLRLLLTFDGGLRWPLAFSLAGGLVNLNERVINRLSRGSVVG